MPFNFKSKSNNQNIQEALDELNQVLDYNYFKQYSDVQNPSHQKLIITHELELENILLDDDDQIDDLILILNNSENFLQIQKAIHQVIAHLKINTVVGLIGIDFTVYNTYSSTYVETTIDIDAKPRQSLQKLNYYFEKDICNHYAHYNIDNSSSYQLQFLKAQNNPKPKNLIPYLLALKENQTKLPDWNINQKQRWLTMKDLK